MSYKVVRWVPGHAKNDIKKEKKIAFIKEIIDALLKATIIKNKSKANVHRKNIDKLTTNYSW